MVKMKERTSGGLAEGALALTLSVVIVKIIGFLYKLPLSHILGDEGMGYFNSAYSVFLFFYMLCTGGVPRAVSITINDFNAKKENYYASKVLSVSMAVFLFIGITFTIALMIFSKLFAYMIGNSLAAFSLFCIAPSLSFVSASGVLRGYLNGKRRMREIAVSEVIEGVIKFALGLTLALYASRHGMSSFMISGYAVLGISVGTFLSALFLFACIKNDKSIDNARQKDKHSLSSAAIMSGVLKISLPITASSAIMGISNMIDLSLIIKRLSIVGFSEAEAVALYGNFTTLALPMLNLITALTAPIGTSALPHLASSFSKGDKDYFDKICKVILTAVSLISFPAGAAYLVFSKEILVLLFNDASALIGAPLLSVLSYSVVSLSLLTVINGILESTLNQRISLISMSIGALFKIVLVYILIGRVGIIGAAISTSISYGVSFAISLCYMIINLKTKLSLDKILSIPFFAAAASALISKAMYNYLSKATFELTSFFIAAGVFLVLYFSFICIFMRRSLIDIWHFVKSTKN